MGQGWSETNKFKQAKVTTVSTRAEPLQLDLSVKLGIRTYERVFGDDVNEPNAIDPSMGRLVVNDAER